MDTVRTRSILTRGSPEPTRRWFEEFGIASAEGPLRTPADPDAGILTRLMLPVRHAGRTRGYLWLLDGGRIDPADTADPALAAAVDLAADAGRLLAEQAAVDEDLGRPLAARAHRRALRAVGSRGNPRRRARRRHRPGADGPDPRCRRHPAGVAAARGRRRRHRGRPRGGRPRAAAGPGDLRPAGAVAAATLGSLPRGSTAGVSRVRRGTAELAAQWSEACAAARVAAVVPRFSPVAHWPELGAWRVISAMDGADPAVLPLLADAVLSETAEVFLDCAGSASRAAAALTHPPADAVLPAGPHRVPHRPRPVRRRGPAAAARLAQGRSPEPLTYGFRAMTDVLQLLRAGTATEHADVERTLDLMSPELQRSRLIAVLDRLHGFWAAAEAGLDDWADRHPADAASVDWARRRRAAPVRRTTCRPSTPPAARPGRPSRASRHRRGAGAHVRAGGLDARRHVHRPAPRRPPPARRRPAARLLPVRGGDRRDVARVPAGDARTGRLRRGRRDRRRGGPSDVRRARRVVPAHELRT